MRLLLIEDEPQMVEALKAAFARHDILVDAVSTIADAEFVSADAVYDAALLDRQLPDGDGLRFVATLRKRGNTLPVIVLTAMGQIPDRVAGLDLGADDYMCKPFDFDELLARLRAVLRRPEALASPVINIGRLSFDPALREARVNGRPIGLARRELLVLEGLIRRAGRMVPRSILMETIFGLDDEIQSNALDSHISRLRRRLAEADAGVAINVVRGVGYLLRGVA
ncbi:response regulator transcription factor [Aestuariivirga sp. YIM B02566]|uniref:Response regulator transcription factor n=1 Tax=Taklimakanibacter albus TaxID=2800327 RepID=A0ACC5R080_9HYPH|nr:response regulator transcription factor [Aestuariivirga sp. YIM B02566]MBK1866017.1 response regulator transcription factor [Aestuariivirga sp. YIM B02566]